MSPVPVLCPTHAMAASHTHASADVGPTRAVDSSPRHGRRSCVAWLLQHLCQCRCWVILYGHVVWPAAIALCSVTDEEENRGERERMEEQTDLGRHAERGGKDADENGIES